MSDNTTTIKEESPLRPIVVKPMFGRADHRLDPKRRLTIPTSWFERMGRPAEVYAMPSLTQRNCIELFCSHEFDRRIEKMSNASLTNPEFGAFLSNLGELIECVSVDCQNRIRLRDSLLAFAGLKDNVVLIGAGFHLELWSLDNRPAIDGTESKVVAEILSKPKFLQKIGLKKEDDDA